MRTLSLLCLGALLACGTPAPQPPDPVALDGVWTGLSLPLPAVTGTEPGEQGVTVRTSYESVRDIRGYWVMALKEAGWAIDMQQPLPGGAHAIEMTRTPKDGPPETIGLILFKDKQGVGGMVRDKR